MPKMPIKCGGAPVKIVFLSEDDFTSRGIRNKCEVEYWPVWGNMFPPCPKYEPEVRKYADKRGIKYNFFKQLIAVDSKNRIATFQHPETKVQTQTHFDLLHIVPHQEPHAFIKNSPLADAAGWVDVHKETLQHNKFKNVFAIGDCSSLPTSKTAAAVISQAPVLVNNLLAHKESKELNALYDGYTSCPMFVGNNELLLIEFKYGGVGAETFSKDGQLIARNAFFHMKKDFLPYVYWNYLSKGKWFGNKSFFAPKFK